MLSSILADGNCQVNPAEIIYTVIPALPIDRHRFDGFEFWHDGSAGREATDTRDPYPSNSIPRQCAQGGRGLGRGTLESRG